MGYTSGIDIFKIICLKNNIISTSFLLFKAFCSTITGTLAMKAVFAGIGVGDSNSTPLAAVFTWLTKDGISMIGKIGFASWKG